jgi:hypothetical protein
MLRRTTLLATAALMLAVPATSSAQAVCVGVNTCSINPNASLTIPKVVLLEAASSAITLLTPDFTTDSLDNQLTVTNFGGLNVRSNHDWSLSVSAAAANWTYTPAAGAAGGSRVRADLEFQANCAGGWTAMAAAASTISSGTVTNGTAASMCFRTTFPNDYSSVKNRPGSYALALTLTITAL